MAGVHGLFVLAMSAAGVASWKLNESLLQAASDREDKLAEAQEVAMLGSWEWDVSRITKESNTSSLSPAVSDRAAWRRSMARRSRPRSDGSAFTERSRWPTPKATCRASSCNARCATRRVTGRAHDVPRTTAG